MQWDDLKYFLALFRSGTLSAAARTLGAEHSTVARRIASLEEGLGMRLFERSGRGFSLTAEGEAIADIAARVEEETLNIARVAQGRQSDLAGVVRISAPPTFASRFIAPRLTALRRRYPGIELELAGDSRAISLSRRDADIAIRLSRPTTGSIVTRRVGTMAFGLYGQRDYLAKAAARDRDFLGYDDSLDHVLQQQWLRRLEPDLRLAFRSNELTTLHEAAAAGMGLAVLPRFLGDPDERLAMVATPSPPPSRELWLLVHPDLRRSPRIRAVLDHIVDIVLAGRAILDPEGAASD